MIVFDLACADGHRFEGWFHSSADYDVQTARGLVECPQCGSSTVDKAPMAPAIPVKGNRQAEPDRGSRSVAGGDIPLEVRQAMRALAEAQARALRSSTWVGESFAEESRAMHYGEREVAAIHGKATVQEAKALLEEGIEVAPLLVPISDPDELN